MDFKARAQMWLDSPKVSDADKEIIRNSSDDKLRDMFGGDIALELPVFVEKWVLEPTE